MIESLKLIRWILFICFLCQGLDSMCQMRGIVYDAENGNPISGVYIYCDSGQTISISDGSFEINCKNGLKIFFSYLGYQTDSLLITEVNDEIKFYLKASSTLLNQVVIKGPLLETNYFKQPASIVSLSNKQIKSSRAISFIDQLNQLPGIFAQTGTFNTNRITIRGIGSRTPFGTNRIRALYDDIPLTSGEGFTSLEDIDPSMIKNINIIKGSKSAVYGSGLGGIILIKGQDYFEEGIHGELGMEAGDYSYIKPSAKLSYRKNNFFITAGFSKTKTNGWRENNSFDRIAFHINSKYKTKKFETSILMYSADVNAQIPSSLSEETFLNSPEKAATNWLAVNGFEDYKRTLIGWNSKWSIHQNLAINFTLYNHRFDGYESRPFNILDDDSSQLGVRTNIQYSINRLKFRMGMEWAEENYNWQIFDTNAGEQGSLISEYKEKRKPKNYYLSASYSSPTGITVEAGLSYNRLNYEIEDLSQGDFNFSGEFKYEPILSPFAGINIPIKNQHRLFASVGHGFSYPTVEETLLQTGINPDLKPEMGWTF